MNQDFNDNLLKATFLKLSISAITELFKRHVFRIYWHILPQGDGVESVDSKERKGQGEIKIANVV